MPSALAAWPLLLVAFAIGSIPFGLIVSRAFFRTDIRSAGSGNIGAANALRTLGKKAGAAVLVLDALKGAAAVALVSASALYAPLGLQVDGHALADGRSAWPLGPLGGLAAVLGHCFTPWLRFRGGKGVATFLGSIFALSWPCGLAFAAVWLAAVAATGYSSLGSMLGTLVAGGLFVTFAGTAAGDGDSAFVFAFGCALVILSKHRENIARLRAGTENHMRMLKR